MPLPFQVGVHSAVRPPHACQSLAAGAPMQTTVADGALLLLWVARLVWGQIHPRAGWAVVYQLECLDAVEEQSQRRFCLQQSVSTWSAVVRAHFFLQIRQDAHLKTQKTFFFHFSTRCTSIRTRINSQDADILSNAPSLPPLRWIPARGANHLLICSRHRQRGHEDNGRIA